MLLKQLNVLAHWDVTSNHVSLTTKSTGKSASLDSLPTSCIAETAGKSFPFDQQNLWAFFSKVEDLYVFLLLFCRYFFVGLRT